MPCSNGNAVEQAKSHGGIDEGVMSRWPDQAEGGLVGPFEYRINGGNRGSRGQAGCVERLWAADRILLDPSAALGHEFLYPFDVGWRMHALQLRHRCESEFASLAT